MILGPYEYRSLRKKRWYAVYTRSRYERKVYCRLLKENIECFMPTYKTIRQWSDRKKRVELPLFTSYVFVCTREVDAYIISLTEGIVRFVSFEGRPAEIPLYQIENLKILSQAETEIEKTTQSFAPGQKVTVATGKLKGLIGELVRIGRKNRLLIRVEHISQNLLIEVPASALEGEIF
ncbi:MAG: UpxY family transcription antiterminator [Bacteroidales bacterium]|nr:UpxY family transcription antiterminator [Bacteroidales bacterium]